MVIDKHIQGLIFDLDGTIADSLPVHLDAWNIVCSEFGYTFPEEKLYEMTGMPTIDFANYIKADSNCEWSAEEIMKMKQQAFHNNLHKVRAIDAVVAIVKKYSTRLPLTVGTGGSRKSAHAILHHLNLGSYFDFVVTASDVSTHKPSPETFLKCAILMDVRPKNCLVFEDGQKGIEAAIAADMPYVDVRNYAFHINNPVNA